MGAVGSTDSAEHRLIANSDAVSSILVLVGIHAAVAMTRVNHALHTEVWGLDPLAWTLLTQREDKVLCFRPIESASPQNDRREPALSIGRKQRTAVHRALA